MRNFPYWFVNNAYNPSQIREISEFLENYYNPELIDAKAEFVNKTAKVRAIEWYKIKHLLKNAEEMAKWINLTEIGYDIYDFNDFQGVNYNVYDSSVQGQYDWHMDASPDEAPTDLKLTVIINISTERYEGGRFKIFRQGVIDVPEIDVPGNMIIFPGFFNHKVEPVSMGTRKTASFWIYGPKFR